jgi:hypothetical protein
VPFETAEDEHPTVAERVFLDELGIAGHPSQIGGMELNFAVNESSRVLVSAMGNRAIFVINDMAEPAKFSIPGQVLTTVGKELLPIANSPPTDMEFLRKIARKIYGGFKATYREPVDNGLLTVQVGESRPEGAQVRFTSHFMIED